MKKYDERRRIVSNVIEIKTEKYTSYCDSVTRYINRITAIQESVRALNSQLPVLRKIVAVDMDFFTFRTKLKRNSEYFTAANDIFTRIEKRQILSGYDDLVGYVASAIKERQKAEAKLTESVGHAHASINGIVSNLGNAVGKVVKGTVGGVLGNAEKTSGFLPGVIGFTAGVLTKGYGKEVSTGFVADPKTTTYSESGTVGGVNYTSDTTIKTGAMSGKASAAWNVSKDGMTAGVKAEVGYTMAEINHTTTFGDENASAVLDANATFMEAKASAEAGIKLDKDGNVDVKVNAEAGLTIAAVDASATVKVGGVEAKATVKAEIGLSAHFKCGYSNGKFDFDVGGALGIGGSLQFSIKVPSLPKIGSSIKAFTKLFKF